MMATTTNTPNGLSICRCGHVGDAPLEGSPNYDRAQRMRRPIEHAGIIGHGECEVCPPGECVQFRWKEFIKGQN